MLAFDKLAGVSPWLSDALCRLASGGSFAVRRLDTDEEEVLFRAARPTSNGIEDVIGRADLADRTIFLMLAPIAEKYRRSESELWPEFEVVRASIVGALVDAVARGLASCGFRSSRSAAADGRLCALRNGLRNWALARGHFRSSLQSHPHNHC